MLNDTSIEQINKNEDIYLVDGTLTLTKPMHIGDDVAGRMEWNEQVFELTSYTQFEPILNGTILDFIRVSYNSILFITKLTSTYYFYHCISEKCVKVHSEVLDSNFIATKIKMFSNLLLVFVSTKLASITYFFNL